MLGYLCAYYRYYYPIEFCTAFLNCSKSDEDIYNGTMLAQQKGFKIEQPKFRKAGDEWRFDKKSGTIYKSLKSIKDIGDKTGSNLLTLKDFTGDFVDLLVAIRENKLAKKNELDILIKLNFFSEFGDINRLLYTYNIFQQLYSTNGWKKNLKKDKAEALGIVPSTVLQFAQKESPTQYTNVNMSAMLKSLYEAYNSSESTIMERIKYEQQLLGYIATTDPEMDWRYSLVLDVSTKYTPTLQLHCIKNGKVQTMKIKNSNRHKDEATGKWKPDPRIKVTWKQLPLQKGDLIYIKDCFKDNKMKKVDDKWVKSDQFEWILSNYSLISRDEEA